MAKKPKIDPAKILRKGSIEQYLSSKHGPRCRCGFCKVKREAKVNQDNDD